MADCENDSFNQAEHCWVSGDVQRAIQIHLHLIRLGRSTQIRLQSVSVLVERLKPVTNPQEILEACTRGIALAGQLNDTRTRLYLVAKKGECLTIFTGLALIDKRKRLRMSPGWFGFSLERDEQQFKELTQQIESNDAETNRLINDALTLSAVGPDGNTRGHVLLLVGSMYFHRYMNLKADRMRARLQLPEWAVRLLKKYGLDEYVFYESVDRVEIHKSLEMCEDRYLEAADAFRIAGEELESAYAFYNLANALRSAYRFGKANRYLKRARAIGETHNDQRLLSSVNIVEKSIRVKNRDVPNYLAGESRQPHAD